jgi:hypothetical protein
MENFVSSPFIVPVAGCAVGAIAIVSGIWFEAQQRRNKADQRMAMIARGIPIAEIERLLGSGDEEKRVRDPLRSLGNARRTGIVLVSVGLGLMLFFISLYVILHERDVLAGAAVGIIPLAIGVGFFIDYNLQKRELSRFGLEVVRRSFKKLDFAGSSESTFREARYRGSSVLFIALRLPTLVAQTGSAWCQPSMSDIRGCPNEICTAKSLSSPVEPSALVAG